MVSSIDQLRKALELKASFMASILDPRGGLGKSSRVDTNPAPCQNPCLMTREAAQPYEFKDTYQFRFTRKIADGGMGSIYEAHLFGSEGFEKTVTIKTIR